MHESIRDFFLFHFQGRYFRCIDLPFAWCRAAFWFVNMMKPFIGRIRRWEYRVLEYIDDFLIALSIAKAATSEDCILSASIVDWLMRQLGLAWHQTKGVWDEGATCIDHLGFTWGSVRMMFTVTKKNQEKVRDHARRLLKEMR